MSRKSTRARKARPEPMTAERLIAEANRARLPGAGERIPLTPHNVRMLIATILEYLLAQFDYAAELQSPAAVAARSLAVLAAAIDEDACKANQGSRLN
ncbi:MAG: hypothetical protein IRZ28_11705 [Steroidobacteraceae bacterium]|nr:hypothetical protein [Steroidobacteraceae bacterium]